MTRILSWLRASWLRPSWRGALWSRARRQRPLSSRAARTSASSRFGFWTRPRTPTLAQAIDADIDAYVELLVAEKIAQGAPPAVARRDARLDVGGVRHVREAVQDAHTVAMVRPLLRDLRYATRMMRRTPLVTGAIVLAMALGIGATATTFSAVDAVLIRPLPYADADRLVVLLHGGNNPVAGANVVDWQHDTSSFESMGAAEYWSPDLRGAGAPEKIMGLRVTPEVLVMLGVSPALGRLPQAGAAGEREVVIADGLWHGRFGGDWSVVGRTIGLDADPHVIVGVMPATFHFAPFWATHAQIWAGLDLGPRAADRGGESLRVFAKLRRGVTLAQARADVARVTGALEMRFPGTNRDVGVTPLKDKVVGDVRPTLLVLFGAVGCVLLIACANVAHLLLARAATRRREFAVRCAIGASRARVVRQLLTESVCLSLSGGAAGLLLAIGGVQIFRVLGSSSVPRLETMALDGRVVALATALSVMTGILFGLAPARLLARLRVAQGLNSEDRGSTTSRGSRRARRWLVGSQVAMALVLLAGAGLLVRSFVALRAVDPGFAPDSVASFVVSVAGSAEAAPGRRLAFYDELRARLRATPGVASVGAINHMPLVGDLWNFPYQAEGRPGPPPADTPTAAYRVLSAGYFETMGIRMVAGRSFTESDRDGSPLVAIVNENFARTVWPGGSAIGARIMVPSGPDHAWRTIIGVSRDTVRADIHDRPAPEMFFPLSQNLAYRTSASSHNEAMTMVVRTSGEAEATMPAVREVVRALAPDVPVSNVFLMRQVVEQGADGTRFTLVLLGTFAGVALVLASLGILGVMSHDVAGRRREIGIRLALGATRGRVVAGVMADGVGAAGVGLVVGLAGAWALRGSLATLLFGVSAFDLPTVLAITMGLAAVVGVATAVPAVRASRVNLLRELR